MKGSHMNIVKPSRTTVKAVVLSVLAFGASAAMAQTAGADTFDASAYATKVTAAIAGILAVGGAVFGVNVAIKSLKWARRSL